MERTVVPPAEDMKTVFVKALKGIRNILILAGEFVPFLKMVDSGIVCVLKAIDDEDIEKIRKEFDTVNEKLINLSKQNHKTLDDIRAISTMNQLGQLEDMIKIHYRLYTEMVKNPNTENAFKTEYSKKQDSSLYTLYDSVMGTRNLFTEPILDVFLKYSAGNHETMERLCTHIINLFIIAVITHIGFASVWGDNKEYEIDQTDKWAAKIKEVIKKIEEVIKKIK